MLFKISIAVAVVSISYAHQIQPQLRPNHATSFQSFTRKDVPIAYQFKAVHSTANPTSPQPRWYYIGNSYNSELKRKIEEIQYAPLLKPGESPNYELHSKYHMPHTYYNEKKKVEHSTAPPDIKESKSPNKDYLEPKLGEPNKFLAYQYGAIPYVPEHLMQAVSRSPGHNAVYNKYTDNIAKTAVTNRDQKQINYQQLLKIYKSPYTHLMPKIQLKLKGSTGKPPVVSYLNSRSQPNIYNAGYADFEAIRSDKRQLKGHPKTHKILLNLSRTYNIKARIPCESHTRDCIFPNDTQAIGLDSVQLQKPSDINTHLYPVPHKHSGFIAFQNLIIRRAKL